MLCLAVAERGCQSGFGVRGSIEKQEGVGSGLLALLSE